MTQDEIIEMAKEAGFPIFGTKVVANDPMQQMLADAVTQHYHDSAIQFAKLVAEKAVAKDRQDYFVSLDSNEMLLRLVREHNGEFCYYVYKFSDYEVMNNLDSMPSMVAEKARRMACKVEAAIKAKGQA